CFSAAVDGNELSGVSPGEKRRIKIDMTQKTNPHTGNNLRRRWAFPTVSSVRCTIAVGPSLLAIGVLDQEITDAQLLIGEIVTGLVAKPIPLLLVGAGRLQNLVDLAVGQHCRIVEGRSTILLGQTGIRIEMGRNRSLLRYRA